MNKTDTIEQVYEQLIETLEALRRIEAAHRQADRQLAALYQRRAELTAKPTEQPKGPQQ